MTDREIKPSEQLQEDLIFKIAKITAENDSISEGYLYCQKYDRESFELEKKQGGFSHYSQAVEIFKLFASELNLLHKEQEKAILKAKIEVEEEWKQAFIMIGDDSKIKSCDYAIDKYTKELELLNLKKDK
jgi:hypothetical protein